MAENITSYINRAGRTGRNGIKGECKKHIYIRVISLMEEKNRFLFLII
jgi:superfamily II DNA/RNA helicase